jgi:ketosteroid isomerase-like protein
MSVDAVLAAERARAAALMARDREGLAALLHEGLVWIHATGVRHDHAQLLDFVANGPRFLAVALHEARVEVDGRHALLDGELHLRLQRGDAAPVEARSWASALWRLGPAGWRLRLFQSTRRESP